MTESSTTILRRMLDERGVEWKAWDGTHPITVWHDETYLYEFIEYRLVNGAKQVSNCPSDNDGHCELTIKVFNCTPEQAIAATLGTGTCHNVNYGHTFVCSECGANIDATSSIGYSYVDEFGKRWYGVSNDYGLNYCPNCGAKVVYE